MVYGFGISQDYMTYSLNSLKGGYIRGYIWDYYHRVIKGDTRILDYGSYKRASMETLNQGITRI